MCSSWEGGCPFPRILVPTVSHGEELHSAPRAELVHVAVPPCCPLDSEELRPDPAPRLLYKQAAFPCCRPSP